MLEINLQTSDGCQMVDITSDVQELVASRAITTGSVLLFVPHTTAGITVNENWDPDVQHDILWALEQMVPHTTVYRHSEGNSRAHIQALLTGDSLTIPIAKGRMRLGRWQGIFFCEYDGPRRRRVCVHVQTASSPDAVD